MAARRDGASTSDTSRKRLPLSLSLSLAEDPERLQRMWAMTPQQRIAAARQGQLSLGEMLRWAARHPREVPLLDGEFSSSPPSSSTTMKGSTEAGQGRR